jgi:hypothetical protein
MTEEARKPVSVASWARSTVTGRGRMETLPGWRTAEAIWTWKERMVTAVGGVSETVKLTVPPVVGAVVVVMLLVAPQPVRMARVVRVRMLIRRCMMPPSAGRSRQSWRDEMRVFCLYRAMRRRNVWK